MALFEWTPRYSVGVDYFDEQHKVLFDLLNSLHDSVRKGHSRAILGDAFQQMREYTMFHFAEEEEAMKLIGLPRYEAHYQEHDKLRVQMQELFSQYLEGKATIGMDTLNFVLRWWTDHIQKTDREYKNFFLAQRELWWSSRFGQQLQDASR